jgi:hypothetical protein
MQAGTTRTVGTRPKPVPGAESGSVAVPAPEPERASSGESAPESVAPAKAAAVRGGPGLAVRPIESIREAEREYLEAITLLDSALAERRASLGPELGRELDKSLRTVDEAIAESRKVYRAHPHDFELAEYMLAAYARKIEVLQELGS